MKLTGASFYRRKKSRSSILKRWGSRDLCTNTDTLSVFNMLFHASDQFQATFDRAKGCTYEFDKQTIEGRRKINSTLKMDYAQSKSILDEKNLITGQSKHVESPIPNCMTRTCSPGCFTPHRNRSRLVITS